MAEKAEVWALAQVNLLEDMMALLLGDNWRESALSMGGGGLVSNQPASGMQPMQSSGGKPPVDHASLDKNTFRDVLRNWYKKRPQFGGENWIQEYQAWLSSKPTGQDLQAQNPRMDALAGNVPYQMGQRPGWL